MIVVRLAGRRRRPRAAAQGAGRTRRRGATLDDHRAWIERMRAMARTTIAGGIGVLLLMLAATVLSVIFATRGAMATNRPIVEVLHFIGAKSGFIAKQFQRHFLVLGLEGGLIGGGPGDAGVRHRQHCREHERRHGRRAISSRLCSAHFRLSLGGYIAIVAQIVLMAVVTAIASRRTVNRTLEYGGVGRCHPAAGFCAMHPAGDVRGCIRQGRAQRQETPGRGRGGASIAATLLMSVSWRPCRSAAGSAGSSGRCRWLRPRRPATQTALSC